MGAIEDTRKVVQGFLAPELREIKARIESLEQSTKTRFEAAEEVAKARFEAVDACIESLEKTTKARFEAVETSIAALAETTKARFAAQDKVMDARHSEIRSALTGLTTYAALAERLSKLENERGQQAAH